MHPFEFHETFKEDVKRDFHQFLQDSSKDFEANNTLKIDLHCHDENSDVTDDLWGRILHLPETWLKTNKLIKTLHKNGADVATVTNHNNAKSCWSQLDKGKDILVGAEFTCKFPEYNLYVHILTYGFTPEQETILNRYRHNVYRFLDYTVEHDIPTILPHPLYFYTRKKNPPMEIFEKFALMFERFEALNGQRDVWQNLLTATWLKGLTPEILEKLGKKHGISPGRYCKNRYEKRVCGGSDDHFGIFAGGTGTKLYVPDLKEKCKSHSLSSIALEAIKYGRMAPYGDIAEEEKLNLAFLDYFAQVSTHIEDPGLIRMFLHRGSIRDKLSCLAIANAMMELKRHKYTLRFLKIFHQALSGKKPGFITRAAVSKDYKPLVQLIKQLAKVRKKEPMQLGNVFKASMRDSYTELNHLLSNRLSSKINHFKKTHATSAQSFQDILKNIEIPTHFRSLISRESNGKLPAVDMETLLDNLSFPLLISSVLAASSFAATKVLYKTRPLLDEFSYDLKKYQHSKRALWITDTLNDKNGVSTVLKSILNYVRKHDLPIDFLVCGEENKSESHLHIVKYIDTFTLSQFSDQEFRVPNILMIQEIFNRGGYDRVICSTELLMGPVALYLKQAFCVPAYFYMHTDWLEYAKRVTSLERRTLDRLRRILRFFYQKFDGIFVLNSDHKRWLTSSSIGIKEKQVWTTAHWVDDGFQFKSKKIKNTVKDEPIFLYAGRLSEEKGVLDVAYVIKKVRKRYPKAKLWVAGVGPEEDTLKKQLPFAEFFGWVNKQKLSELYQKADLFLFPSTFDTFGCAVLESLGAGLPVIAYDLKGPKDIIEHGKTGYLCQNKNQMVETIFDHQQNRLKQEMSQACIQRAESYEPFVIMKKLLAEVGLLPQNLDLQTDASHSTTFV